ncbi:hypothetical protein C7S13_8009 [Burkholderia cepacia]|nr:hypothetical protein [Burkholderia cepacia]
MSTRNPLSFTQFLYSNRAPGITDVIRNVTGGSIFPSGAEFEINGRRTWRETLSIDFWSGK